MAEFFSRLSTRDKKALIVGSIAVVMFLMFEFIFVPLVEQTKNIKRIALTNKSNLITMMKLKHKYKILNMGAIGNKDLLIKRGKNFSLFSYLDQMAEKCLIKKNVVYMKPFFQGSNNKKYKKAFVKVRLESISLKECVAFLDKIEKKSIGEKDIMVSINSFSISSSGKNNKLIDAVIEAETIIPAN